MSSYLYLIASLCCSHYATLQVRNIMLFTLCNIYSITAKNIIIMPFTLWYITLHCVIYVMLYYITLCHINYFVTLYYLHYIIYLIYHLHYGI